MAGQCVLVKKANGKWQMCIAFIDLNRACPKDSYPLPRIDQLVDATTGHKLVFYRCILCIQSNPHGTQGQKK